MKTKRNLVSWILLVLGLIFMAIGVFFNWHKVYYKPTKAEIQEALNAGEEVPRLHIYYCNENRIIEGLAFEEFEVGENGELEKVPALGFCAS